MSFIEPIYESEKEDNHMRLEIGNFYVKDTRFADKLSFDDGVLTINKEKALDFIREDERITEADLYIAKPGDKIRMCPVKECNRA